MVSERFSTGTFAFELSLMQKLTQNTKHGRDGKLKVLNHIKTSFWSTNILLELIETQSTEKLFDFKSLI